MISAAGSSSSERSSISSMGMWRAVVEPAEPGLPVLADVEEHEGLALGEPLLQFHGREFGAHGLFLRGRRYHAAAFSSGSRTEVSGETSTLTWSPSMKLFPTRAEVIISTLIVPPGIVTS